MKWMTWAQARLLAGLTVVLMALPAQAALQVFASANPVAPGATLLLQWEESAPAVDGYTDADFLFSWDPAVLDLTGAGAGTAFGSSTLSQYPGFGPGWTGFNILRDTSVDVTTDGVLMTLQFQVLASAAPGATLVSIFTNPFGLVLVPNGYYIGDPSSLSTELEVSGAVTPIPEPATVALTLAGLGLLGVVARRRRG